MIHVIMGLKGSGKTKKLIDAINAAVAEAHGDVVCIEYGRKLTYDVTYKVRLVDRCYLQGSSGRLQGVRHQEPRNAEGFPERSARR